jgi:cell division protein FtsZ
MAFQEILPEILPGAKIKVFGVGGAGCNTVNRMIKEWIDGVEFVAVNTDAQVLATSLAHKTINIWLNITKGLGAWANPEVWRKAAEESLESIKAELVDTDMVFITAGMWWWTGTGAAPVIGQLAKSMGILAVGVVTKPFSFEWKRRFEHALEWLTKMRDSVDTLIVIPNDKIFNIIDKKTTFKQAFSMIDKILYLGVQGISDLIIRPGDINIDFADIRMIMQGSWTALLGIWYGQGEDRAIDAARRAIDNPLLEASLEGAKNIIFAVTGWEDLTPIEVQEAARVVEEIADPDAMIVWWMTFDESYEWEVKVSIIATWFPEQVQETMIKSVWTRGGAISKLWTPNTGTRRSSTGAWYIWRAMSDEWVSSSSEAQEEQKEERDFDTPAIIRKKLLNG